MPSTNPGAHDPSEVEAIKRSADLPEGVRPDGTPEDPPPVPQQKRRRLVRRTTRRYVVLLVVAALMVVTAIAGLSVGGGDNQTGRTVIFTAIGLIGALLALASTVWRGKVGDDLDEAKL